VQVAELSDRELWSDHAELAQWANSRTSLLIASAQNFWPELHQLVRDLEQYFSFPINANAYYSRPHGSAFAAHYDRHDVLILQISGSKLWSIGAEIEHAPLDPPLALPFERSISNALREKLRRNVPHSAFKRARHSLQRTLRAGDALYIPRGFAHKARAVAGDSLHVTLGILPITWADVLHTAVREECARTNALRANLPIGFANVVSGAPQIPTRVPTLSRACVARAVTAVQRHYRAIAQSDGFRIATTPTGKIHPTTLVERSPGVVCSCWQPDDKAVAIKFLDKTVREPRDMLECFQFLASMKRFPVNRCPFPREDAERLKCIRRFVRAGLLVPR
jgi:hypothetical protein